MLLVAAEPLVIHEKERAVLAVIELGNPHRPTERESELVITERRESGTLGVEKIPRVHGGVAQEFEQAAVEFIGARLRNHIDHRAGIAAELGAIKVGLHLELADRFDRRAQDDGDSEALIVVDSVVEEIVRALAVAVREQLAAGPAIVRASAAHNGAAGAEARAVDAGDCGRQRNEVAAVERQLIHEVAGDDAAD